ncbi:hypothetical protein BJ508DRAFT_336420 [Ascobolus immersus RN42]|uniref:Uncharacterized protein n=1 Tax=Ascobolus immersus RN42 TaxID=1160509 RepID=A0A3N4HN56_ASCIM|nr:hypothetical protein BJ508DRAFT_336420 [Ascobolus immersus RN42]
MAPLGKSAPPASSKPSTSFTAFLTDFSGRSLCHRCSCKDSNCPDHFYQPGARNKNTTAPEPPTGLQKLREARERLGRMNGPNGDVMSPKPGGFTEMGRYAARHNHSYNDSKTVEPSPIEDPFKTPLQPQFQPHSPQELKVQHKPRPSRIEAVSFEPLAPLPPQFGPYVDPMAKTKPFSYNPTPPLPPMTQEEKARESAPHDLVPGATAARREELLRVQEEKMMAEAIRLSKAEYEWQYGADPVGNEKNKKKNGKGAMKEKKKGWLFK